MKSKAPDKIDHTLSVFAWFQDIALAIAVAAFCWIMTSLATNGPEARARALLEATHEIEAESQAFCTKLKLVPSSQLFVTCTHELEVIRRNHGERTIRDAGLL